MSETKQRLEVMHDEYAANLAEAFEAYDDGGDYDELLDALNPVGWGKVQEYRWILAFGGPRFDVVARVGDGGELLTVHTERAWWSETIVQECAEGDAFWRYAQEMLALDEC